jgi:pSer/pThr/pTyr-binding forkhead associated (FHA) protein
MVGRFQIVEQGVVLGGAPPAQFILADELVSPQHCRVFRAKTGGRFWIEDLQSDNATSVNGKRVERAVLKSGDRITVGATTLVITLGESDPRPDG